MEKAVEADARPVAAARAVAPLADVPDSILLIGLLFKAYKIQNYSTS
jgi:hypothetical protein